LRQREDELTVQRGDLCRREDRRRHLVAQRLKDMVVAALDQDDIDVRVPQRTCSGDPGKAGADDDDALPLSVGSLDAGGPCQVQSRPTSNSQVHLVGAHCGFSELMSETMLSALPPIGLATA
jgi:hypothetical protein